MKTLPLWHLQRLNLGKSVSHSGVQKLTASAILNPKLKPLWYADESVMMNSPGFCICLLNSLDDLDVRTHRLEQVWVNHSCFVTQQLVALNEFFRHSRFHKRLEFLVVRARYSIPELRCSIMVEVDARHVEVLNVPRECCPEAAYVQVGRVDACKCSLA